MSDKNKQNRAWELLNAIGEADERFIADADHGRKPKKHRRNFWAYGAVAACLALALLIPVTAVLLRGGSGDTVSVGSDGSGTEVLEGSRGESGDPAASKGESDTSEPSNDPDTEIGRPLVITSLSDLMTGIHASPVAAKQADDAFLQQQMRFSLSLFRQAAKEEQGSGNSLLLSPLSVQYALSMAANGARGQTQKEMLSLLAGNLSMDRLNGYLHTLMERLTETGDGYKVNLANAIWYNEWVQVYEDFLQTNADYYGAGAYRMPFDEEARNAINAWASEQTDGMVPEALKEIDPEAAMYLLNATLFDAEWTRIYLEADIRYKNFTSQNGETKRVPLMYSWENIYYEDGSATGFAKPYKGGKYAFVALLPNEGVDVYDYVAGLTAEKLLRTLQNGKKEEVAAFLPKFSSEYETKLEKLLPALGMESAFVPGVADFSGMMTGFDGNGHLEQVNQKTVISVGELGTKAAAVTDAVSYPDSYPEHEVILNRPFVYMIVDTETNLPLFMGVQTEADETAPEIGDPVGPEPYEPTPPVKEDYTGLTVSVSPVTEDAMALDITFENNRAKDFHYNSTDVLLQRKTANGYEDFPFLGKPDTLSTVVPAGGVGHDHFRLERDFGVTLRAGEVYRLLLTNVEDEQLYCEFTVGEPTEGLRLSIWVEEPVSPSLKFLFFELRNEGALDLTYCYADVRLERLTDKGWETFSRIDDDVNIFSDMLVKAGESAGGFVNPEQYGVTWQSGVTYRITLATVPGVYGEFTVE